MAFNYSRLKGTSQRLIERFGRQTSATILRRVGGSVETYPPTPGVDVPYNCRVVVMDLDAMDRQGTDLPSGSVKLLIAPDAAIEPENQDRIRVGDDVWHVEEIRSTKPGDTLLMWTALCSLGDYGAAADIPTPVGIGAMAVGSTFVVG